MMKRCSKCGIKYPATTEYFGIEKRTKSGLQSQCRECQRVRGRRWRAEHPERRLAKNRRWRSRNPDFDRRWRAEHLEQCRESTRRWQKENPEKKATNKRNRRARLLAANGTHTAVDIEAQYKRQRGKCYYCGCKMTKKSHRLNSATVDHVVPLDRGGRNDPSNLVIACSACNSSKRNRLPHEWGKSARLL
jgi:5-methylcytosine-specific restriction endonuclease McrA